jgi:hypothetical protein
MKYNYMLCNLKLRDEKSVHSFSWKPEGKGMLGKLGIDERTLLKSGY